MKNKRIVAASAAAVLSLGLAAAPVATAQADPPAPGVAHGAATKAEVREAWATLKAALKAASRHFVMAVHTAQMEFRVNTKAQRAALTAVLKDPDATDGQKASALIRFRADTAAQRATRKASIQDAVDQRQDAKKAAWKAFRLAVR